MTDPTELSATQARRLIAAGALSAGQLLEACIARIAAREPEVRAWAWLDLDAARARARELDAMPRQGPLHGIPVGIKDIIDTRTMPTAWGSPAFADRRPDRNAACVDRLEAAGAIVLGKNVTTEFAYFSPGPTRNPHDPARTPGGSSSGSAAAVADRMVPLSIGTQAAGSTIRPASFCGVPAFKPSHGRWDMAGGLRLYPTVDTLSVFCHDFADAGLVDSVLAGAWDGPAHPVPPRRPERAVIFLPAEQDRAAPEAHAALDHARRLVETDGVPVREVRAAAPFDRLAEASDIIVHVEAARHAVPIVEAARVPLSPVFLALIEKGAAIPPRAYEEALAIQAQARRDWPALAGEGTLVLTFAATGEAPVGLGSTGDPVFIRTWNVVGAPSVNLPLFRGPSGLPVGVQAVGVPGGDRELIAHAAWAMTLEG